MTLLASFCCFRQQPAYEMRISDWSSGVCSSDLFRAGAARRPLLSACCLAALAGQAPVAQLDRALPSEGRGQRFESSRVRHTARSEEIRGSWLDHSRTKERIFAGMRPGSVRLVPICGCFPSCAFYPKSEERRVG